MKRMILISLTMCLLTACCYKKENVIKESNKDYVFLGEKHSEYWDTIDVNVKNYRHAIKNAKTAVDIAEAILNSIYGEQVINQEKPFDVTLLNNKIWYVKGKSPQHSKGGVATIWLRKDNGAVISVSHSE